MPNAQAAVTERDPWADPGCRERGDPDSDCAFRQLRHHTKNVLQQMLLQIADAQGLRTSVCSSWLLAHLHDLVLGQQRIAKSQQPKSVLSCEGQKRD